ncbi:MAG: glycosyltransferase, partial [Polyangiaceae bacterium]
MIVHGPYPIGEPRVAREVAAAVAAGWDVDVIALRRRAERAEDVAPAGERVHRLPLEHRRGGGALGVTREYVSFCMLAALTLLRLSRGAPFRVVQVHNPPDFLMFAALPCRWLFGSTVVFDVHDLAPDMFEMRFGERGWSSMVDRVLRAVERLALRRADEVLTVHEPYASELRRRGADPERLTVVMNSVDPTLLPEPGAVAERNGAFRVVYHGTVTPSYGVDLLVEAAALALAEIPELTV